VAIGGLAGRSAFWYRLARMDESPDLGPRLTKFAHKLLDEAEADDIPLDTREAVFKTVATWWVASTKRGSKDEEKPKGDVASFDAFRQKVAAAGKEG
jgi:hypothetical protein